MSQFQTDPELIMESVMIQEAIADVVWSLIPEQNRDTTVSIPSTADAMAVLEDLISDRVDALASIEETNGAIDKAYNHPRGIAA